MNTCTHHIISLSSCVSLLTSFIFHYRKSHAFFQLLASNTTHSSHSRSIFQKQKTQKNQRLIWEPKWCTTWWQFEKQHFELIFVALNTMLNDNNSNYENTRFSFHYLRIVCVTKRKKWTSRNGTFFEEIACYLEWLTSLFFSLQRNSFANEKCIVHVTKLNPI